MTRGFCDLGIIVSFVGGWQILAGPELHDTGGSLYSGYTLCSVHTNIKNEVTWQETKGS